MIHITGSALERARRLNAMEDALCINARTNAYLSILIMFAIGAICAAAFGG